MKFYLGLGYIINKLKDRSKYVIDHKPLVSLRWNARRWIITPIPPSRVTAWKFQWSSKVVAQRSNK